MALYFFHTETADSLADEDGVELPSRLAACEMAIKVAGELMRDGASTFWATRPWKVTVTDGTGLILLEIEMCGYAAPAFPN